MADEAFSGIPFGRACAYRSEEATRLLRAMLNEMRRRQDLQRELGMDPKGKGRRTTTEVARRIWDFLPLAQAKGAKAFNQYPHLTLSVGEDFTFAHVTIPNGVKKAYRDKLLSNGKEAFRKPFSEVCANLAEKLEGLEGASPWVGLVQRHYPFRGAEPILDAALEFDLRTAVPLSSAWAGGVKYQPHWLDAVYGTLSEKRSNLQLDVGARFVHDRCEATRSRSILELIANAWLACKPLVHATVAD